MVAQYSTFRILAESYGKSIRKISHPVGFLSDQRIFQVFPWHPGSFSRPLEVVLRAPLPLPATGASLRHGLPARQGASPWLALGKTGGGGGGGGGLAHVLYRQNTNFGGDPMFVQAKHQRVGQCTMLESASVYLSHPPNIRQNHPSHHPPCVTTSRASSAKSSPPGQAILRIIPPAQNHPLNHPPCPEPSSESSPLPRTILRIIPPAQNHPQNHPPCPEPSPESSPLPKTI